VGYTFMLKVCYGWLVAPQYRESLNYIYPLGISAAVFAISAFFDMGYQCAKDTKRTLPAIVLASIVNILLNFALIKPLGVYGVIVTQFVSYIVLVIYRWHDMKRYFTLKMSQRTIVPIMTILLSFFPFYYNSNHLVDIAFMIAALAVVVLSCDKEIRQFIFSKLIKTHDPTK